MKDIVIEKSWVPHLEKLTQNNDVIKLTQFLIEEYKNGTIYPQPTEIFNALNVTPLEDVKVVILGQDPYHGEQQAHGLSFSVNDGIAIPPSLQNIFKELENDIINFSTPESGNLTKWAERGVLLLNTCLTVRQGEAGSHRNRGWEVVTDVIIKTVSSMSKHVIFLLWGNHAQQKTSLIDARKHLILTAPHPSPLSAYKGFFGCNHFSKANEYLIWYDIQPIDWRL